MGLEPTNYDGCLKLLPVEKQFGFVWMQPSFSSIQGYFEFNLKSRFSADFLNYKDRTNYRSQLLLSHST